MAAAVDLKPPNVSQWMQMIDVTDAVLLTTSTFCSTVVITVAFIQFYLVNKYVNEENVRHNLWWIVFMLPCTFGRREDVRGMIAWGKTRQRGFFRWSVLSDNVDHQFLLAHGDVLSSFGMFLFILAICYLMVCLMIIAHLMQNLFGGRFSMVEFMRENNLEFKLSVPPFCCCFKFLRPVQPTERNVEILEWLVSQTVFVRIILEVGTMVAFLEETYQYHIYYTLADVICVISLLISIFACEILMPIADAKLKGYSIRSLFNAVNVTQVLFTMQKIVFDNLLKFGVLTPGALVLDESRSQFYSSALFCIEAFLISIWLLIILNPNKTKLFDGYKTRDSGEFTENGHLVRNSTQPQIITLSREVLSGEDESE
ncbi:hypothetical protein L596_017146 [Steinernema carpocapsae]|uniref:Uncharacterized protein n=1 Tax=Steinernema carpocapsae TaxID=34508 RepID=A0A4U5N0Q1_STECR|nr:hypothetical protein L596_017146 [Steinernema carpocapsae]